MNITDIEIVEFSNKDIADAEAWADFMDKKNQGEKTVRVSKDQNKTGYLGHTAIERIFESLGVPYYSTKTVKFKAGDNFDLHAKGSYIDSKSHKLNFNENKFFSEQLWVFGNERKLGNYYTFTRILPDFSKGYVYGIIDVDVYYARARTGTLKTNDYRQTEVQHTWVLSRELTPISKWILGV